MMRLIVVLMSKNTALKLREVKKNPNSDTFIFFFISQLFLSRNFDFFHFLQFWIFLSRNWLFFYLAIYFFYRAIYFFYRAIYFFYRANLTLSRNSAIISQKKVRIVR